MTTNTFFSEGKVGSGIVYPGKYVYMHAFAICILSSDIVHSANKENRCPHIALEFLCPRQFCLTN